MDYLRRSCRISRIQHIPNGEIKWNTGRVYKHDRQNWNQTINIYWYGHVMKMEEEHWPKRAFQNSPGNRRRRGSLQTIWEKGRKCVVPDTAKGEEWNNEDRDWNARNDKKTVDAHLFLFHIDIFYVKFVIIT